MDYKVKAVNGCPAEYYECRHRGYKLFEDENRYYSVYMQNGKPDPTSWASLNYDWERDMPVFTHEYCEYHGYERDHYDTITIVE